MASCTTSGGGGSVFDTVVLEALGVDDSVDVAAVIVLGGGGDLGAIMTAASARAFNDAVAPIEEFPVSLGRGAARGVTPSLVLVSEVGDLGTRVSCGDDEAEIFSLVSVSSFSLPSVSLVKSMHSVGLGCRVTCTLTW